jgi:hypothetical protein
MQSRMDGELEQMGERIAEQAAHLDAAMHRLLADLREFDERGGWYVQGALSCAHWLSWRVGWELVTARERVRVAHKLAEFPAIDDALRRGEVSYSKVRAMVRVATPANEALLLDHARLMTASQLEKLSRKYALVQRHGQDPHPVADGQRRYVRRRDTEDGMIKIEAVLHPEEAELVWATLNHAATQLAREPALPAGNVSAALRAIDVSAESRDVSEPASWPSRGVLHPRAVAAQRAFSRADAESRGIDASAESRGIDVSAASRGIDVPAASRGIDVSAASRGIGVSAESRDVSEPTSRQGGSVLQQRADAAQRAFSRADALVSLAQGYLRGDRPNRSPIEVTLTIPASSLGPGAEDPLEAGELGESFLSTEAARRLSCDAGVVEVIEDEHGVPLSVGRKRRTISGALKRALYKRDSACTFPGCTHRIFLEGHHIKHWADGGETSLPNTALLCSSHHRHVHEYGYEIELGPDQRPRFRDPHGRVVTAAPPRPAMSELGWPRIRAMNEPLAIDADTIACGWNGKPVDYGTIVGHLVVADRLR